MSEPTDCENSPAIGFQIPQYSDDRLVYTTEDEWTTVKYVMEVLRPFRYRTLWITKLHTVTLHHVITIYHDMFNHMDGVLRALAKMNTQWKEDLYFAVKFARQKLSKDYAEGTPMTGMVLISAQNLDPFRKLQLFRKWDKGMDINPEIETSYTTQYQDSFLKYVENEYCTKLRPLLVTKCDKLRSNDYIPSATAAQSGQSSFDPDNLSSDDEEYLTPRNVAVTTPRRRNHTAHLLIAARLFLN